MIRCRKSVRRGSFLRDTRGNAAAEFALWVSIMLVPVLSATDLSFYAFQRMMLESAAEAAVQTAWHTCNQSAYLPLKNCSGVLAAMRTAAQNTSLNTSVTLADASVVDRYYCASTSGVLQTPTGATSGNTTTLPTGPATCSSVTTGSTTAPGEYVEATVTYTYTPLFSGLSIGSLLPTTVTKTASMRLS